MATRQQQQIEAQQQILVAKVTLYSLMGTVGSELQSGVQSQLSAGDCGVVCKVVDLVLFECFCPEAK